MNTLQLGAVLTIAGLALLALIPIATFVVHRRSGVGMAGWFATATAVVLVAAALWMWLAPITVDGVTCFFQSPVDGLLPDEGQGAVGACLSQARRVTGGWALVIIAAVVMWGWGLRHARRRVGRLSAWRSDSQTDSSTASM